MKDKKMLIYWFCSVFGLNILFRFINRHKVLILYYHGICENNFDLLKEYDERHIAKSMFKMNIQFLNKKGYQFVTISELTDLIKKGKKKNKLAVLTFDDGFENIVRNAYPIMQELQAKGCFYVISRLINTDKLVWTDFIETAIRNYHNNEFIFTFQGEAINYRLTSKENKESAMRDIKKKLRSVSDKERKMSIKQFKDIDLQDIPQEFLFATWNQIRDLDPNVLEIGSHTRNHPNCDKLLSQQELQEELQGSKEEIEKEIGRPVVHFCYPAGAMSNEVTNLIKEFGYQSAASSIHGLTDLRTDLFKLKRVGVQGDMLKFQCIASGSYAFFKSIYNRYRGKRS